MNQIILSPRQKTILQLLASGSTTNQIAGICNIQPDTVRKHIKKSQRRLSAKTVIHCVALAISSHQIEVGTGLDTPGNQRPNGENGDEQNE